MKNYTDEEAQELVEIYKANPCRETVAQLAEKFERSEKSIIGKLSREGVYRREGYKTKLGEKPITKTEMRELIEDATDLRLEGLEKAPKSVIRTLCQYWNVSVD